MDGIKPSDEVDATTNRKLGGNIDKKSLKTKLKKKMKGKNC